MKISNDLLKEAESRMENLKKEIVNNHMIDGKAPFAHQVLTRNLIKQYPNWIQMNFKFKKE